MKDSLMQNLGLVHLQGLVSSLVLVLLTVCRGDSVQVVGQPEPVVALIGDDVILPCFLNPKSDASSQSVRWRQQSEEVHLYRSKVDANDDQNPVYRLRTSLFKEELKNGNVSLKLNNVKLSDAGTYSCQVPTLDKDQKAFVQLVVDTVFPMTRGQKAGIIIGVIIAVTILSVAGGVYMWRQKKQLKQQQEEQSIIFVDHNRNDLIQRVTKVIPITDELLQMGLIQKEDQSTITAPKTSQDQMGKLYQVLQEGGDETKSAFYKILLKQEPNLLKELDVDFVDKYKDDLIQRVDDVESISAELLQKGLIQKEDHDKIRAAETSQDQMEQLYQVLEERGPDAKSAFYRIIVNNNYFLLELLMVQPEKRGRFGGDPETTSLIKQQQKLKEENGELRQQLGLFSEGDSCGNNEGTEMKPLLRRSPADVDVEKGGIYSNY